MKKTSAIALTSSLVLLLSTGSYFALKDRDSNPIPNRVTTKNSSSKIDRNPKDLESKTLPSTSTTPTQATPSLRADLLAKPVEQKVTDDHVNEGQSILNKRQISNQSSQFNFYNLSMGDFSSLSGTWSDANGYTFEFSPQGLVSIGGKLTMSPLNYDANGEAVSYVDVLEGQGSGGFVLYFYPAGLEIPTWHFGITKSDPSDFGRDRLFASQTNRFDFESTSQFVNSVFYKVSDLYTQVQAEDKITEDTDVIDEEIKQEIEEKSHGEASDSISEGHSETKTGE